MINVAELPELFQLKCLSPALEAGPPVNPSDLVRHGHWQDQVPQSHSMVSHRANTIKHKTMHVRVLNYYIIIIGVFAKVSIIVQSAAE
jgi:hypothetical protein